MNLPNSIPYHVFSMTFIPSLFRSDCQMSVSLFSPKSLTQHSCDRTSPRLPVIRASFPLHSNPPHLPPCRAGLCRRSSVPLQYPPPAKILLAWLDSARLEYKYSRLVMSANKECEMPGADSCAVMEGENEGDMEDEVVYTKPSLLGKLKAIASKVRVEKESNECSCIFITSSIGLDLNIAIKLAIEKNKLGKTS